MSSRREKLAELAALRKSGKSSLSAYKINEDLLYDVVDESVGNNHYDDDEDDDFIEVNDGDHGYSRNDGSNDIGGYKNNYYSDDDERDRKGSKKSKHKDGKRRKAQSPSPPPPEPKIKSRDISEMFRKAAKAKVKQPKRNDDDLEAMISTLGDGVKKPNLKRSISSSISNMKTLDKDPFSDNYDDLIDSLGSSKHIIKKTKLSLANRVKREPLVEIDQDLPMSANINYKEEEEESDSDVDEPAPLMPGASYKSVVNKTSKKPVIIDINSTPKPSLAPIQSPTKSPSSPISSPSRYNISPTKLAQPPTPAPPQSSRPDTPAWMNLNETLVSTELDDERIPEDQKNFKFSSEDVVEEDGKLRIFWTDYHDFGSRLGLFGKVKNKKTGKFGSVFVVINNIQRELYFLPKPIKDGEDGEQIPIQDVYTEVCKILSDYGVNDFRSKPVTKKYAFEIPDVPAETDYLQVLYNYQNFNQQVLPADIQGETFSHVFGTHTALFEQFVLSRNVMGPCWLEIESPNFSSIHNASWCDLEVSVDVPMNISVVSESETNLPAPPLTVMSLSLRTIMNKKENKQEVAAISARVYTEMAHDTTSNPVELPSFVFTYVRPITGGVFPMGFEREMNDKKRNGKIRNTVRTFRDESGMLAEFLKQVQRFDPDVFVAHSLENVHFNILSHRIRDKRISGWSRLGRCRQTAWPSGFGRGNDINFQRQVATGRLLLDISNTYGQSLTMKCDSWTLTEMTKLYLHNQERLDQPLDAGKSDWVTTSSGLYEYLMHNETDTFFSIAIALRTQMLALSKQLTNIAGNSWARVLTGTRAERNEFILLHEFHRQNYILPDKYPAKKKLQAGTNGTQKNGSSKASQTTSQEAHHHDEDDMEDPSAAQVNHPGKKKEKYKGGLVFEPERGLYDKIILVMDFNSLYPSIIQEFNICFTTVDRRAYNTKIANGEEPDGYDDEVLTLPDKSVPLGIFPRLVQALVQRRRAVKNNMKDPKATPTQKAQWDIKQQALKLTANSMYGCLGYIRSRFYARPLAVLTTYKGREILMATKTLAETNGLQVIYGDTDSVMINTNVDQYDEALKIGNDFKLQVNQRYKLLEIDIDNVFRRMLLHAKKKYAAVNMTGPENDKNTRMDIEVKGLDMKRREYCILSKEASKFALNEILGTESSETAIENIHEYLRKLALRVRENKVPLGQYLIRNRLGKNPKDYPGGGLTLPHVVVAQRLINHGEVVRPDDIISYVIAEKEEKSGEDVNMENDIDITGNGDASKPFNTRHPAQRALTRKEVDDSNGLYRPDAEYYLTRQILPPLERLIAPMSGTNAMRLADCLGLDLSKYQAKANGGNGHNGGKEISFMPFQSTIDDSERFRDSATLMISCGSCSKTFAFIGLNASDAHECSVVTANGIRCSHCSENVPMSRVNAQLEVQVRSQMAQYYAAWVSCAECGTRTRQISVYGRRCLNVVESTNGVFHTCGGLVSFEYGDLRMYNQLLYYDSLFDVDRARRRVQKRLELIEKGSADPEAIATVKKEFNTVNALAEHNRGRFAPTRGVVEKYLTQCGRRYVDMKEIFAFAR